jgi:hypothetical protein
VSHAFHGKVGKFHVGGFIPRREDGSTEGTDLALCGEVQWSVLWAGSQSPSHVASACPACAEAWRKLKAKKAKGKSLGHEKPKDKRPTAWTRILLDD